MEKDKLVILAIVGVLGYFLVSGATGTLNPSKWTAPTYRVSFYLKNPWLGDPEIKDVKFEGPIGAQIGSLTRALSLNPIDAEGKVKVKVTYPDGTTSTILNKGVVIDPGKPTTRFKPTFKPSKSGTYKIEIIAMNKKENLWDRKPLTRTITVKKK